MSNHVWVCFDCRQAVRRPSQDPDVRCSSCGATCTRLGTKVEIPPKARADRWRAMRERFLGVQRRVAAARFEAGVRRAHDLEHEIERLSSLPEAPGRRARIRELEARLAEARPR